MKALDVAASMRLAQSVRIRLAEADDLAYVADTYADQTWRDGIPRAKWGELCEAAIARSIDEGNVFVACSTEDASQIFGWARRVSRAAGFNADVLDYVYVRMGFRGFGISKELVPWLSVTRTLRHWPGLSVIVPLV